MRVKTRVLYTSIALTLLSALVAACESDHDPMTTESDQVDQSRVVVETVATKSIESVPLPTTDQIDGLDPDAYDFKCADGLLGMEITDQIFPAICADRCRPPTVDELATIEPCLLEPRSVESYAEGETKPAPIRDTLFDPEVYDIKCLDRALGGDAAYAIADGHRKPTEAELEQMKTCLLSATELVDSPAIFDPDAYDVQCADGVLGMETTDQIFPEVCADNCRAPTADELTKIKQCLLEYGAAESLAEDEHEPAPSAQGEHEPEPPPEGSIHTHIVRATATMPPLPEGFVAIDLTSLQLPDAGHVVPQTDGCEVFDGDNCAELLWEPVSELRAGEFTAIQISPTDPDIMYAGIDSNDMSLYQSKDGGTTWKLIHITGHTSGVSISPTDSDVVIYSNLEGPMERTTDGGLTWNSVDTGDVKVERLDPAQEGANIFTAVVFAPDNGDIAYTATVSGMHRSGTDRGPIDFYISTNGGKDWDMAGICESCGGAKMLAVQPGDSNVVWAATNNGVQVSRDGGKSWSGNLIEQHTRHAEILGVALRPGEPDTVLAAGAEAGMFRSTDGGETWVTANVGLSTQLLHQVIFAPSNSDVAYVATHDGVYRSDDAGVSWVERNNGLLYKFTTPIAVDPRDEDVVFAGSASEVYTTHPNHFNPGLHEGEGLYKSTDGGRSWFRSDTGIDEAKLVQMATHPLLPFNLWADGESGRGAFFTPDAGQNWLFSPNHAAHYPMVFAFSRTFPTELYLTSWMNDGELMTSKDGGHNWTDLTPLVAAGISDKTKSLGLYDDTKRRWLHLHGLAVSESDSNIIYVGSVNDTVYPDVEFNLIGSHIFKSVDGGLTFKEMSNGFPIETRTSINAIVIHPSDPTIAYAMTSLHETETAIGIYKTLDGATTWSPINNGLDPYTNDLQIDPTTPDTLYAAAESGIYKTTDGGDLWERSSNGIPDDMPVIDLAIDPLNPLVLYAITPDHVYRTKNGGKNWYTVDLGLPLLSEEEVEAAKHQLPFPDDLGKSNRARTGHSEYARTFAQDRSLEIDATGRILYVVVKTKASDKYGPEWHKIRRLYRAVLPPLILVEYQFEIHGNPISVASTSHVYDLIYNQSSQEMQFTAAGPKGTTGKTSVKIADALLTTPFTVAIDGQMMDITNDSSTIKFEYEHNGRSEVVIRGR